MQLTDTHCHIHEAQAGIKGDDPTRALWRKLEALTPDDILQRAAAQQVTRLLCVGTSAPDSQRAVAFAAQHSNCWASIGLHPHEAKDGQPALDKLAKLATNPKVVAVGECGLDYFYNHSPKQDQIKALRFQIELALANDLPLIFHVREAFDDFWPVFNSYKNIRGVLHSFTDSRENLDKALAHGLYIGVNGIVTFAKNGQQQQNAKAIPLQNLLLETDAPFLTPVPFRGNVNEPAHLMLVAEFLAELRGEPVQVIAARTSANAQTLFNL